MFLIRSLHGRSVSMPRRNKLISKVGGEEKSNSLKHLPSVVTKAINIPFCKQHEYSMVKDNKNMFTDVNALTAINETISAMSTTKYKY